MSKKLLAEVLSIIKPESKELKAEVEFAKNLVEHLNDETPPECDVILTGSIAKKTFLKDKRDIDIFILFDRSVPRENLEPIIKEIMKVIFPKVAYQLSYAEHPYARFYFEGRRIDLVPAYKISKASERISAVDRSVLHTKFVKKNLKKKQTDDVLLLKQFLRANSLYGAEIRIAGFSGYLCELFIIKYGNFEKFLQTVAKWKLPVFLDIEKHYKKEEISDAMDHFGSFVVVDPTDKNRNVAAAVSKENLMKFIKLAKNFLKKPSKTFFLKKPETFEEKLAKQKGKFFTVSMPRPNVVDDVLWGQLHKMTRQIEDHLEDFEPKKIIADDSKHLVRLLIVLGKDKLPAKMLVEGPPLKMKTHVDKFKKKHKKTKILKKKRRICAEIKRPVTKAEIAIKQFFKDFSKTNSHLAYPEEMVILSKLGKSQKSK